jgi:hypothetical protein
MPDCSCITKCPFFNDKMVNKQATAGLYKKKFCKGDFSDCARYIVFEKLGRQSVPDDLYPNMKEQALHIVASINN